MIRIHTQGFKHSYHIHFAEDYLPELCLSEKDAESLYDQLGILLAMNKTAILSPEPGKEGKDEK